MKFNLTKYINKNDIIAMAIIVGLSTILALFYNCIRTDKIPYFRPNIEERLVSDDELFGAIDMQDNEKQNENNISEIQTESTPTDTSDDINVDTIIATNEVANNEINIETLDYEALLKESRKSNVDDFGVITLSQMQRIAADTTGDFLIIDARRPDDFKEARIGNAINIFPYEGTESSIVEKVLALPKSKTIIVYCDGGTCDSSHKIGEILKIFDYRFFIFEGGWEEWIK